MKFGAYILSLTFVMVFGFLHIDPFSSCVMEEEEDAPTCSLATSCQRNQPEQEKKECPARKGCNPFVPCATSCCYLAESFVVPTPVFTIKKVTPVLFDDNRILKSISECWHPPEFSSRSSHI